MAKELERSYASEIDAAVSGMYEISDRMYDDGLETDAMLLNEGISRLEEIIEVLKAVWRLDRSSQDRIRFKPWSFRSVTVT